MKCNRCFDYRGKLINFIRRYRSKFSKDLLFKLNLRFDYRVVLITFTRRWHRSAFNDHKKQTGNNRFEPLASEKEFGNEGNSQKHFSIKEASLRISLSLSIDSDRPILNVVSRKKAVVQVDRGKETILSVRTNSRQQRGLPNFIRTFDAYCAHETASNSPLPRLLLFVPFERYRDPWNSLRPFS